MSTFFLQKQKQFLLIAAILNFVSSLFYGLCSLKFITVPFLQNEPLGIFVSISYFLCLLVVWRTLLPLLCTSATKVVFRCFVFIGMFKLLSLLLYLFVACFHVNDLQFVYRHPLYQAGNGLHAVVYLYLFIVLFEKQNLPKPFSRWFHAFVFCAAASSCIYQMATNDMNYFHFGSSVLYITTFFKIVGSIFLLISALYFTNTIGAVEELNNTEEKPKQSNISYLNHGAAFCLCLILGIIIFCNRGIFPYNIAESVLGYLIIPCLIALYFSLSSCHFKRNSMAFVVLFFSIVLLLPCGLLTILFCFWDGSVL